jgi:hypothetical protein
VEQLYFSYTSDKHGDRNMPTKSVQSLLEDIRLISEDRYQLVETVRALVKKTFKVTSEEVKYGGILFAAGGVQFGGIFAYKAHCSFEFGNGAAIDDPFGQLEGGGKGRRHVKLHTIDDIKTKKLAQYLPLALQATKDVG